MTFYLNLQNRKNYFRMFIVGLVYYKRLENLYGATEQNESFRHFYSDIFSVLTQIQQDQSLGDINILGQNLDLIRSGYKPQNKDDNGRIICRGKKS